MTEATAPAGDWLVAAKTLRDALVATGALTDDGDIAVLDRLLADAERLRAEVDLYRRAGYRLTLARAGSDRPPPLVQFTVPVGQGLVWEAEETIAGLRLVLRLEDIPPPRPEGDGSEGG